MSLIDFGNGKDGIFNIKLDKSFFDGINTMPSGLKLFLCISVFVGFFYFNFSNEVYKEEMRQIQIIQNDLQQTTKLIYDMNLLNKNQIEINKILFGKSDIDHELLLEVIYTTDKKINLILSFLDNIHGTDCPKEYKQLKQELLITNEYYHKIIQSYLNQRKDLSLDKDNPLLKKD